MKNVFALPIFLALACSPMSSTAWWEPCGAAPHWGGYAPPYPVYAPPPWAGGYAYPPLPRGEMVDPYAPPPATWGQPMEPFADDMMAPQAPSDHQAPKDQRGAQKELEDRRAAFRSRMEAHQAAVKARREAWRQYMDRYYPEPPTTMDPMTHRQMPAAPTELPSVERKPAPLPGVVPNTEVKPKTE